MLALIALLILLSIGFLVQLLGQLAPGPAAVVTRRLAELELKGDRSREAVRRRRRQARTQRITSVLLGLGGRIEGRRADASTVRMFLIRAGYQHPNAVAFYWGVRVVLAGGLGAGAMLLLPVLGIALSKTMAVGIWLGAMGWIGPAFVVRRRMLARQKDIQLALPDMLDLLVVCVEAGLGLNQALVRVAEEIDHVSHVLSEQITLVNLEIRAGKPRDQALWNLGDRTGVPDVQSLCGILVQTDRFGTSVAQALRVHAETLRTKRRQRAEEAAAKTTIKLIFPLALFIFPAMFVVILAPALIALYRTFGTGAN